MSFGVIIRVENDAFQVEDRKCGKSNAFIVLYIPPLKLMHL